MSFSTLTSLRKAFLLATTLLTRIPVPAIHNLQAEDSGRSALFYPVVGLLIGLILVIPVVIFGSASVFLLSSLIVVIWAVVTGGLHFDGLADSADAWLGGMGDKPGDNDKTHSILKDPVVGSAGVVTIVSIIVLKIAAISTLLQQQSWTYVWIIILAPMLGRTIVLLLLTSTDYVRINGLGNAVVDYLPRKATLWVAAISSLFCLLVSPAGFALTFIGFWLLRRIMQQRLGGCTGDTLGASVEITEMLWLLGAALFISG
jgi:adenosylcobinamide-GDP ribazoletransferase